MGMSYLTSLKPQKYSICWVFQAYFCSTFFYMYFAAKPSPMLTAVPDLELPCVVCAVARWLQGSSAPDAPMSTVADIVLKKTEHEDPFGLLESVLYCDEHRVTLM